MTEAPDSLSGSQEGVGQSSRSPTMVDIHYARLGKQTVVYRQHIVHHDRTVVVSYQPETRLTRPLMVEGEVILTNGSPVVWFTFPDTWHDIGLFHLPDGRFTGTYANILTPVEGQDDQGEPSPLGTAATWTTTDLFLDVWLPAQGGAVLLDEPELADAEGKKLVTTAQASTAREEAMRLLRQHAEGLWPPGVVSTWSLTRAREAISR